MGAAFLQILVLTVSFIVMIILFGGLYSVVRKRACRNIQRTFGTGIFLLFSFIGTPIHELSHYLACLLFRHKVTKVVLFSPKMWKATGTLGVVQHCYNTKSLYQRAGNFLIGTAPLFGGAGVSFLILRYLGLQMHFSSTNILTSLTDLLQACLGVFNSANMHNPFFWILLFVLVNIFLHVSLSTADLRNASTGVFFFVLLVLLVSGLLFLVGIHPERITDVISGIFSSLFFVFTFGILIDGIILVVSEILLRLRRMIL